MEEGRSILVKMVSIGDADASGTRQVILELNGERWFVSVTDSSSAEVRSLSVVFARPFAVYASVLASRA